MSFPLLSRRAVVCGALAGVAGLARPARAQTAATKLKMVLNWKYEGPQGWFFLAEDRGYFHDEGIEIAFDQGNGSGAGVPLVANGSYDLAFGDINALVELAAKRTDNLPVAVACLYNRPPFVIATKADGGITKPADLIGKNLGGAANDGSLKLFPAFCKIAGIDPAKVTITTIQPNIGAQMLMRGQLDGVFGYYTTLWFATKLSGIDPATQLHFLRYGDYGMDLLSNSIIVSHTLATEKPALVKGFLRALFRGIRDTIADPDAAIGALSKREPLIRPPLEREKLLFTMHNDISDPSIAKLGLGGVDPVRLAKSIDIVVSASGLPRTPAAGEIFTPAFLPPLADRPTKLP
jgi:NitT/TauT family transport system substrate-binding protein